MPLADTSFLDVLWWMLVFFFWVMYFWIFISIVGDLFRRDDIGGWKKAGWLVLLIFLPLLGILFYMIFRPKMTAQDVRMMTQVEAAQRAASGVSTADELAKLAELKNQGVLNDAEYEELKRRAMS
jgi:phospholipase D-like protein/putative oligomerization/nucleic acid binding protein